MSLSRTFCRVMVIGLLLSLVSNTAQSWAAPTKSNDKPAATAPKQLDLNTATVEQLQALPGVTSAYAKKIVATRPFTSVKDLAKTGIPTSKLKKIVPLVMVTEKTTQDKPGDKASGATNPPSGNSDAGSKTAKTGKPAGKSSTAARTPPKKGMVWANSDSKVYHVEGDRWYGKTKQGEWMTEDDAVKAGYHKAK